MAEKRIGILTGGGDCPGLNAVIRAAVLKALGANFTCLGFIEGWRGIVERRTRELNEVNTREILHQGGTILGSSRTNPLKNKDDLRKLLATYKTLKIKALLAIGGDDTLGVASHLYQKHKLGLIGIPKTIDNDLSATDYTFGFDTAVNIATEAIDRLHTTAESHNRVMIVEVMGRHAGWIAVQAGLAGGADVILIPEKPFDIDKVCDLIKKRHKRGKDFSIVVVAEGAKFPTLEDKDGTYVVQDGEKDAFGHVRPGGQNSIKGRGRSPSL